MTEVYKLIFDTATYYTLSGFYLWEFRREAPSMPGFALLAVMIIADALLRRKQEIPALLQRGLLLLPALMLVTRPGLWPLLQIVPVWVYLGWSMLSDRVNIDYGEFKYHFSFGLKLLLLAIPGLLTKNNRDAIATAVPYLTLMLACGICLLRMLREKRATGLRQGIYMGAFLVLSIVLTVGQAPQRLLQLAGLAYKYVIGPALFAVVIVIGMALYAGYEVFRWLLARLQGELYDVEITLETGAQTLGLEGQVLEYVENPAWVKTALLTLGAVILLLVLFLIFRRLMGSGSTAKQELQREERRESLLHPQTRNRNPGLIRPRDPRLAVRYYYARFLAECRRRGFTPAPGLTAEELARRCVNVFPGVDPATLTAIYRPARYSDRTAVTAADANRAAEAWKELKRSKDPNAG